MQHASKMRNTPKILVGKNNGDHLENSKRWEDDIKIDI